MSGFMGFRILDFLEINLYAVVYAGFSAVLTFEYPHVTYVLMSVSGSGDYRFVGFLHLEFRTFDLLTLWFLQMCI